MWKADVVAYFGGVRATARQMTQAGYQMTGSVVSQWPDPIPELAARRIAEVTRGAVPLHLDHYRNQPRERANREVVE